MSKQIDKMYEKAIEHITPDILNNILEHEIVPMTEVDDVIKQDKRKTNIKNERKVRPVIGMIGMVVAAMFLLFIYNRQLVETVITIDVNPSFEIQLNKKEEVKKVIAINEEAKKIIKQADISNKKLEVVIEELVVIMEDTGYLKQEAAVLVSVQNKNKDIVQNMKVKIEGKIKNICKEEQIEPVILTQSMEEDKEIEGVAEDYHISKGRAKFICNMAKEGDNWTVEQLASMTIEELVTSAQEKDVDISDILEKQEKTTKKEQSKSEAEQNILKKKESDKNTDDMNEAEIDHTPAPIKNDTEKKEPKKDAIDLETNISSEYEKQETNPTKNKKQEQKEMDDKKDKKLNSNKGQDKSKQENTNSKTDKSVNQEEEVKKSIEEEKEEQTSNEENETKQDKDEKEVQGSGKIEREEEQNVKEEQQKTDKKRQKEQKKIEREEEGQRKNKKKK